MLKLSSSLLKIQRNSPKWSSDSPVPADAEKLCYSLSLQRLFLGCDGRELSSFVEVLWLHIRGRGVDRIEDRKRPLGHHLGLSVARNQDISEWQINTFNNNDNNDNCCRAMEHVKILKLVSIKEQT